MLATGGAIVAGGVTFSGFMSVLIGAFIGSMLIMAFILFCILKAINTAMSLGKKEEEDRPWVLEEEEAEEKQE